MKKIFPITALFMAALFTQQLHAQPNPVASESRDASLAFLGSFNFAIGRVGSECLVLIGRQETPQAFVFSWQQRNAKYLMAMQKYMQARLGEAEATGGAGKRDAVMGEVNNAVKGSAETMVRNLLGNAEKSDACKRAVALIDGGGYDVSQKSPMYGELESLVKWAQ
jgi:hypothetical protein